MYLVDLDLIIYRKDAKGAKKDLQNKKLAIESRIGEQK